MSTVDSTGSMVVAGAVGLIMALPHLLRGSMATRAVGTVAVQPLAGTAAGLTLAWAMAHKQALTARPPRQEPRSGCVCFPC